MLNKLMHVLLFSAVLCANTLTFAALEKHTFEVYVTIPTQAFYVIPADPNWIHREQRLTWSLTTSTLGGLRKFFDVKNEAGSIDARLLARPYLSNGNDADDVGLRVTFNGQLLSEAENTSVVSSSEAAHGKRVLLEVLPFPPLDGVYKPGNYFGSVNIMFEAVMPGA